jgi:TnpA family transposase
MDDLTVRICAVLLAEACNIGMKPFIRPSIPALTRYRLSWTKQNYLMAEMLVKANARLVDYPSTLPLAQKWVGGEVAFGDDMRFIATMRLTRGCCPQRSDAYNALNTLSRMVFSYPGKAVVYAIAHLAGVLQMQRNA